MLKNNGPALTVNSQNNEGDTPLIVAVRYGQLNLIQFLLAKDANVLISNNRGFTPLKEAIAAKNVPAIQLLFNNVEATAQLSEEERQKAAMFILGCDRAYTK